MRRTLPLFLISGLLTAPTHAQSSPEVIFCAVQSVGTSAIPGSPGSRFSNFGSVSVSPSGQHWCVNAGSTASSSFRAHLLVNGVLVLRAGFDTLPWDSNSAYRGGACAINDAGLVVVDGEGTGGVFGIATVDNAGAGTWNLRESGGGPVPGIAGATWTGFFPPLAASDGSYGIVGNMTSPTLLGTRAFVIDGVLVAEDEVTVPTGSVSGAAIRSIETGFGMSADGSSHCYRAFAQPGAGEHLVVNGAMAIEADEPLAGVNDTRDVNRVAGSSMDAAGRAYGFGLTKVVGHDFVWRDGDIIAQEFEPIVPGSSEIWRNTSTFVAGFTHAVGHVSGDYLVVGQTSANGGDVMVKNGTEVVLRAGDPIDLDGNGAFDDDCELSFIRHIARWAANDEVTMVVALRTSTFGQLGDAIVRMSVPSSGLGRTYCNSVPNSSGAEARMVLLGSDVVAANDLVLGCLDLPPSVFGIFVTGQTQGFVQNPGGVQGNLCLGGAIGRMAGGSILNSGPTGRVSIPANLTALPTPNALVAGQPGETWNFQFWFRDVNPQPTANYSSAMEVTLR